MKFESILGAIGQTPHIRLSRLFPESEVWIKLERQNPGGSIKDRIALGMVEAAEARGELRPGMTIVEPTSGNTGIGLAIVAAIKGYRTIFTMPESMSLERRRALESLGAEIVLTPRIEAMPGAIKRAEDIAASQPDTWIPRQFDNPDNPETHRQTTAREIVTDFSDGLDCLVTGIGTGGHITGVGSILKETWAEFELYGVEPASSNILSGGTPNLHRIQGVGAGFIPGVLEVELLEGVIEVTDEDAYAETRSLARTEGIWAGISTGANIAAVKILLSRKKIARVLTFCYDSGERYLSVKDLF